MELGSKNESPAGLGKWGVQGPAGPGGTKPAHVAGTCGEEQGRTVLAGGRLGTTGQSPAQTCVPGTELEAEGGLRAWSLQRTPR